MRYWSPGLNTKDIFKQIWTEHFPDSEGLNTAHVPPSSMQSSCPEGALLSRHTSINSQHTLPTGYNQNSSPSLHPHHLYPHPAPNAHSSPRGSQMTRAVQYNLNRSPALSFDEEPDSLSFEPQQPPLPEKLRTLDCERPLGSVSPAPSGFSSPHSGSSLSIPFPNSLPELHARSSSVSPLPGKIPQFSHDAPVLRMSWGLNQLSSWRFWMLPLIINAIITIGVIS